MLFSDATAMSEAVRNREMSAEELVQETIAKIENLDPSLNALTSKRYEKALQEAKERDFSGKPFAGVPLLLKDLGQNQAGEPSTGGSRLLTSYRSGQTDNYVQRLEDLGFIILGRTNTPEFGFKNISDAKLHGAVNLPDDLTRNAGGSSGGAAAAVSSGMLPLAATSDGGGSIRIPAAFNGLVGLKPTRGRIPVGPESFRGWQGASINFALTRTMRDTRRLLYHLQTCQLESPFILPKLSRQDLESPLPKSLRIAVQLNSPVGGQVSEEAQASVLEAARFLEGQGYEIHLLDRPPLDGVEAMQSYYLMNAAETAAMFDHLEEMLGRPMMLDDMELMSWALFRSGQTIPAKLYSKVLSAWDTYSHHMAVFHQTYDLLLTPTTAEAAPKHGQFALSENLKNKLANIDAFPMQEQQELIWEMFSDSLDWTPFTQQANLTGQPAISLPTGRTAQGLALGIHFTAAKGREDLLLAVGQLFEESGRFI